MANRINGRNYEIFAETSQPGGGEEHANSNRFSCGKAGQLDGIENCIPSQRIADTSRNFGSPPMKF